VRLTLLYITYQAVIPAKAGIQFRNPGFRVKPGMTIKVKGFLTHYTNELRLFLKRVIETAPPSMKTEDNPLF